MINSPYKFLDFYGINDKDVFFGREREANILVADVVVNRLVVLFARTGTGKTSLINAGVRPLLEARDFQTFYIRVEQDPTEAARAVLQKEKLLKDADKTVSLSAQLCTVVEVLNKPIVLFFDQFEEFFLHILDRETRQKFIKDISEVYRNTDSGVHLVFSMREEYFYRMDEFREDIPSIFHKNSNLRLMPLDEEQARAAIIKPAAALDVEIDLTLANEIIKDLNNDKDGIRAPSLQIICDTLWRREDPADRHITFKDYDELGRGQNILDKRLAQDLENAIAGTNLISLTLNLIDKLRTDEGTKYPRVFSDLVKILNTDDETLHDLVSRLKGVEIIKEMTISNAPAIEWASDYLAERTNLLLDIVKSIELRGILQKALEDKARPASNISENTQSEKDQESTKLLENLSPPEWGLSLDEFLEISRNPTSIKNLERNEIEFLFDTSLYCQRNMEDWFGRASQSKEGDLGLLRNKLHDKDTAINVRQGVIILLGELGSNEALQLLEEALNEPELSDKAIDVLIATPGDQAYQLLAKSLERDDLWESTVFALARSGTEQAVSLLKPLLKTESKFFQILNALERLAKSGGPAGSKAEKTLESAIPLLEEKLKDKSTSDSARSALVRLSKFRDPLGSMAQNTITQSKAVPVKKQERSKKRFSERIEDFIANSRSEEIPQRLAQEPPAMINVPTGVGGLPRRRDVSSATDYSATGYIDDIMPVIGKGTVIPIISNSLRIEQIFRSEQELADRLSETADIDDELTISEQLTKAWASEIQYPMADGHNLARVAQYFQVEQKDSFLAKSKYLKFLNSFLLNIAEDEEGYQDVAKEMRTREARFSQFVQWLDYPRYPSGVEDPLRLLAKLPLKIYVTTSYYDFMERALEAEDKKPRTQVIFWSGGRLNVKPEHLPDPLYVPSDIEPAVYHLYGLEDYPQTLVLTEDDYLNFLISVLANTDNMNPAVPIGLRQALAESHLLLLGYHAGDLDFRTLFQFISKFRRDESAPRGMLIQPNPGAKQSGNKEKSAEYLSHYFDKNKFGVEWTNTEKFIQKLWIEWDNYIRGQL